MICIGSDHAGYELKEHVKKYLLDKGFKVLDIGPETAQSVDYPLFGQKVGECVARAEANKGIVICGTGLGISMAANKVPGVRAALCTNTTMARLAREHNDANVLALGARIVGSVLAEDIVDAFLSTDFSTEGRHGARIALFEQIEEKYHSRLD